MIFFICVYILLDTTMNISQNNVSGECNLKCSYSFQYSNSGCVATNMGYGRGIMLSYDESNVPPVIYNGNKYKVGDVQITTSNDLLYNGKTPVASLSIDHAPISGGVGFSVVIPIMIGSGNTSSSTILTTIINDTAKLAPNAGNKTNISLDNYNLNNIVPKKPFYSFSIDGVYDMIVYGIENAISVDADTLNTLNTITTSSTNIMSASYQLFYNSKGPNSSGSGSVNADNIYIDCQPVNMSEETIQVSTQNYKMKSENNLGVELLKIYNNPWFQLLLLIFAVVIFYYIIQFLLKLGDASPVK